MDSCGTTEAIGFTLGRTEEDSQQTMLCYGGIQWRSLKEIHGQAKVNRSSKNWSETHYFTRR
jgi:hypothetical protein